MDKDFGFLNDLIWSYRASRILQVATDLGLFTQLGSGGMDCGELANVCRTDRLLLEKVLIACCALGLLRQEEGQYYNTEMAEQYLVAGRPQYQGDIIKHAMTVWRFWDSLPETIRIQPEPGASQADHRHFILGMHNITMGERGKLFLDHVDLKGRKHMIDIGGGPGTYSILACRHYPRLRSTVFDLSETIQIAREVVSREGLEDRIDYIEGSWETHDFGCGYDVALLSNVLHGTGSQAEMKLAKAYQALNPGGLVAVQEFLLNNKKTGPQLAALFHVMVGAYSEQELLDVMRSAGFSDCTLVYNDPELGAGWILGHKSTASTRV